MFYCFREAGCQVAACSTILFSVDASSLLQMQNDAYPKVSPKALGRACPRDLLLCWYSVVSSGFCEWDWKNFTDFLQNE